MLNFTENKSPASQGRATRASRAGQQGARPGLTCSSRGHSAQPPRSRFCAGAPRPGRLFSETKGRVRAGSHPCQSRFHDTCNATWFASDVHLHFQMRPIRYWVSDLAVSALKLSFRSFIVSIKKKNSPSIYSSTSAALGRVEQLSQPLHGLDLLSQHLGLFSDNRHIFLTPSVQSLACGTCTNPPTIPGSGHTLGLLPGQWLWS